MRPLTIAGLSFLAGYVDTTTFMYDTGQFSVFVTGNIIIFAMSLAKQISIQDFFKLLSIPVMIMGVYLGSKIHITIQKTKPKLNPTNCLMLIQSTLFATIFIIDILASSRYIDNLLALLLVITMSIQLSIHAFQPIPMTLGMTGNTLKLVASHATTSTQNYSSKASTVSKPLYYSLILSFLFGAVVSAFMTKLFGLKVCGFCAILMLGLVFLEKRNTTNPA